MTTMLNKLKTAFSFAPSVEFVDFEDGLLTVKCKKSLNFKNTSVKVKASFGTVLAQVLVESYDVANEVYRLKLLEGGIVLNKLATERREHPRLPKVIRVTSQFFPGFAGTTEDLSLSGMRVTTQGELELATDISLNLELDDPEIPPLRLQADVAWTGLKIDGNYQSGLRFTYLSPDTQRTIKRYINSRLAMEKRLHTLEEVDPHDLM